MSRSGHLGVYELARVTGGCPPAGGGGRSAMSSGQAKD